MSTKFTIFYNFINKKIFSLIKKKGNDLSLVPINQNSPKWSDRMFDPKNYWFMANKMEDDSNFAEAIDYYIKDVQKCINNDYMVRAAFSCSCIADCLSKFESAYTITLYRLSALLYEKNANFSINRSLRESLWSLQQSYENFLMARDIENARKTHSKYTSLAIKISSKFLLDDALNILESNLSNFIGIDDDKPKLPIVNDQSQLNNDRILELIDLVNSYLESTNKNEEIVP